MISKVFSNKYSCLLLVVLFLLGFIVRLYRIDNPIADWHAWRQADTAAVSKMFVEKGFDILHPQYFDISNVQSGMDNPQGYRMVEFPTFNIVHAFIGKLLPAVSFDLIGRLLTSTIYLTGGLFLYLFARKHIGSISGFFALFYYLFIPFGIFYSRAILPDPVMISFLMISIWAFDNLLGSKKKIRWFLISFVFIALSLLSKPYAIFFVPVFITLAYLRYGIAMLKRIELFVLFVISITPFALWRLWIAQFPEGIPSSVWLFNEGNIRFKGAFFYWIFGERIGKLILGYFGSAIFVLGSFFHGRKSFVIYSFILSSLLYVSVIARGNVQHDYYQIVLLPTIAIVLGRGAGFLIEYQKKVGYFFVLTLTLLSFGLSWYYVRDYFNINNIAFVNAGQRANEVLPKDAKVIAPFDGDTSLLYYIARPGWPSFQRPIEELIDLGATYMVLVSPTPNDYSGFGTQYKIIDSSKDYLILDLRK